MTEPIESSNPLVDHLHGIVEAFVDGEVVDPSTLRTALADRAARDHFVDLLLIRGVLGGTASTPMFETGRPRSRSRAKWLAAAAAVMLASLTAGYLAGQRVIAQSAAPSTVEAMVFVDSPPRVPEPTRSITFRPGVNWTDSPGGR